MFDILTTKDEIRKSIPESTKESEVNNSLPKGDFQV
jgi:hypothetical protein